MDPYTTLKRVVINNPLERMPEETSKLALISERTNKIINVTKNALITPLPQFNINNLFPKLNTPPLYCYSLLSMNSEVYLLL